MSTNFVLPVVMGLFVVVLFLGNMGDREEVSSISGFVGAILLIVANAYFPAWLIVRRFRPLPEDVVLFFEKYLQVHMVLNTLAFLAVTIHAHYADERNFFLTGSYIAMIFLTIEGLLMHYRVVPGIQNHIHMLHMQRVLFVVWILLVVIGHSIP